MNTFTKVLLSLPLLVTTVACSGASAYTTKNDDGYKFTFERENITVTTKKEYQEYSDGRSLDKVNSHYVRANGVWESLDGRTGHISKQVLCKVDSHKAVGYVIKVEAYRTDYIRDQWGEPSSTDTFLGLMTHDEFNRTMNNHTGGKARFFYLNSKRHIDRNNVTQQGEFFDENDIICQSARHYNLI